MMQASSEQTISVSEKDIANVKEEEIKLDKNFTLVDVSPDTIWQAKVALFETRFEDAEELLAPLALQNLWAMSVHTEGFVIRYMLEKRPDQLEAAVTRLRTAAAMAVVLIKRYKMRPEKKALAKDLPRAHLLAEAMAHEAHAYMILAMVFIISNGYVKGAYYTRKSWKCWETCQKVLDELEALSSPPSDQLRAFVAFGVGFFFFGISLVPANLEFIVKILGFQGDRERAALLLRKSKQVAACGKSVESALMLYALQFWFTDGREQAPHTLSEIFQELPDSPLLCFMSGWQAMITDHDSDAALAHYKRGVELVKVEQLRSLFSMSLAWCHFVREDWEDVRELLEQRLEKANGDENNSYSCFNLAVAYHMLERPADCKKMMQRVLDDEKKADNWDSYAASVARGYMENDTFDRATLLLLLAENANEAGRPERSLGYLDELDTLDTWLGKTADDKMAMSCYFRGCALRLQKKVSEAKSQLIRVAGMHQKPLSLEARRAIPYSLVVLGEIAMRELGQLDAAGRFFNKAKNYKEKFLFSEILMFRLKSDEEVLADKKKKVELAEANGNEGQ